MPPRTRLSTAQEVQGPASDSDAEHHSEGFQVAVHLTRALKGARKLQKEAESLRKKNEELQRKLDAVEEAENVSIQPKRGRRSGATVSWLQKEIGKLKDRIQDLEKGKEKDRRKIRQLRMKEVRNDAAELEEHAEFEVGDSAHQMRKLLRHIQDLMTSTSLDDKEECPICTEELQPKKCGSLSCAHTFCQECITQLSGEEQITCPQCREQCPRDENEVVQYTAIKQWDALTEVAETFAKMDRRREDETSEEEAEEEFINNGHPDASMSEVASTNPLGTSPEPNPESEPEANAPPHEDPMPQPPPAKKRRIIVVSPTSSPEPPDISLEQPADVTYLPRHEEDGAQSSGTLIPPPATPPQQVQALSNPLYAQTPPAEKRKRMQDLAASRKRKPLY